MASVELDVSAEGVAMRAPGLYALKLAWPPTVVEITLFAGADFLVLGALRRFLDALQRHRVGARALRHKAELDEREVARARVAAAV